MYLKDRERRREEFFIIIIHSGEREGWSVTSDSRLITCECVLSIFLPKTDLETKEEVKTEGGYVF